VILRRERRFHLRCDGTADLCIISGFPNLNESFEFQKHKQLAITCCNCLEEKLTGVACLVSGIRIVAQRFPPAVKMPPRYPSLNFIKNVSA